MQNNGQLWLGIAALGLLLLGHFAVWAKDRGRLTTLLEKLQEAQRHHATELRELRRDHQEELRLLRQMQQKQLERLSRLEGKLLE